MESCQVVSPAVDGTACRPGWPGTIWVNLCVLNLSNGNWKLMFLSTQLWNLGSHAPFPFCLLTPCTSGFTNKSCRWLCSGKKLLEMLEFLFLLHTLFTTCKSGLRQQSQGRQPVCLWWQHCNRVLQSADFRVSSQHWLWPWAAWSSRDRWAGYLLHSSEKTIDWKVFSLCSSQLLLTGWNAAHTGFLSLIALSEFWPNHFSGQLSLLCENGSSNKNYRTLWVLAVV